MIEQPPETQRPADRNTAAPRDEQVETLHAQIHALQMQLADCEREAAAASAREKLLLAELQNGMRNLLAVVRSVFSRTVDAGGTVEDIADHFRGRIDTLTRHQVSRMLDPGRGSDLEVSIRDELRSFEFDQRIDIEGPEIRIGHDVGEIIGLAIHELATNAIKFGALSTMDERARLSISWKRAGDVLTLRWEETGIRVVASAPMRIGFGREYIEQALPYQLGATTSLDLRPGGLLCVIAVPLNTSVES